MEISKTENEILIGLDEKTKEIHLYGVDSFSVKQDKMDRVYLKVDKGEREKSD